jgi:hypothetical protein
LNLGECEKKIAIWQFSEENFGALLKGEYQVAPCPYPELHNSLSMEA